VEFPIVVKTALISPYLLTHEPETYIVFRFPKATTEIIVSILANQDAVAKVIKRRICGTGKHRTS
jgi:hypothetical protein